ncbi:MAG: hypothetical protein HFJ10_05055 [Lachnospiraceae bacterium]|jgi:uroporphyrinogen decarboxylase|nr:hypothetical protein [Lachnospiraceae bacterium]
METMSKMERVKAVLEGRPVDRPPFVAWGPHLNLEDKHTGDFTKAVIAYENQHDFDILKVMQNGLYNTEDYGQVIDECENSDDPCFKKTRIPAFTSLEDLKNVTTKDVHQGAIARETESIKILCDYYKDQVPVLPTIFGPYRMLCQLTDYVPKDPKVLLRPVTFLGDSMMKFARENEEVYTSVMEILTQQVIDIMNAFLDVGAAGFFYCPGGSYPDDCTEEEYLKYIRPYDEKALKAVEERSWFTMLHICGAKVCFMDHMLDLPAQAINWEDASVENPSIGEIRGKTDKVLMGGVDRNADFYGANRENVKSMLKRKTQKAIAEGKEKFIVAVGCESPREITHRFVVWREVMRELADK